MDTKAIERTKLTPPQLAKQWGVSHAKIVALIRTGELRAINLATTMSGRPRYLIDKADIERLEKRREVIPDGGLSTTRWLRRRPQAGVTQYF
jgi:helix-turn-helix protein